MEVGCRHRTHSVLEAWDRVRKMKCVQATLAGCTLDPEECFDGRHDTQHVPPTHHASMLYVYRMLLDWLDVLVYFGLSCAMLDLGPLSCTRGVDLGNTLHDQVACVGSKDVSTGAISSVAATKLASASVNLACTSIVLRVSSRLL